MKSRPVYASVCLQERYEKLSGELSAANDCLARAYAQLETASALLEAEKRKGDALLYQVRHSMYCCCMDAVYVMHVLADRLLQR